MPAIPIPDTEISLSFTAGELSQLEAFASLHGVSLSAFAKSAAVDAAQITGGKKGAVKVNDPSALWLTDSFESVPEETDLFATNAAPDEEAPSATAPVAVAKRGVTGEPSKFARGTGPVWDIRQALGRERVHGLGWTREQMAFVLKLSVVGVRKMEHLGTAPIKSMEARKKLLELSKLLNEPGRGIEDYIEREEKALG
jgi:hypothetical protein